MKVTWEEKDIYGGMRYFHPQHSGEWMIGYSTNKQHKHLYVTISLSDGFLSTPRTKQQLAEILTNFGFLPKEMKQ